jgi:hypothetical protein
MRHGVITGSINALWSALAGGQMAAREPNEVPPRLVARFGDTEVFSALLRQPWTLSADAVVVPTGAAGDLQGGFAQALREAAGPLWSTIEERFASERPTDFRPQRPFMIELGEMPFTSARYLVFATGVARSLSAGAPVATQAVVDLARKQRDISSLVLPLLGSGAALVASPQQTARLMIEALSQVASGSGLRSIFITTLSKKALAELQSLGSKLSHRPVMPATETPAVAPAPSGAPAGMTEPIFPSATLVGEFLKARKSGLDTSARDLVAFAGHLGAQRHRESDQRALLTTSTLFFAMVERGRAAPEDERGSEALRLLARAVAPNDAKAYLDTLSRYLGGGSELLQNFDPARPTVTAISSNAQAVLIAAGELQREARQQRIGTAALVFALLGHEEGRFRDHLSALRLQRKDLEQQLAPALRSLCEPQEALAGFWTDNPNHSTEDYLDVGKEAQAFAYLAASRDIHPPLSIGVFGEWGSGKTFFMERMYELIESITTKGSDYQKTNKFCEGIVQIRFNAWHYIEGNLWASLVEFIFTELDRWLRAELNDRTKVDALFNQLATSKQLKLDAVRDLLASWRNLDEAKTKLASARLDYDAAVQNRGDVSRVDVWQVVVKEALSNEGISGPLNDAATELGLPQLRNSAAELGRLARESRTQADRARLLGQSLLARLGSPVVAALAIAAIIATPLLVEGLRHILAEGFQWSWAKNFNAGLLAVVSILGSLAAAGRLLLAGGIRGLNQLDSVRTKLDELVAKRTEAERKEVAAAEKEVASKQDAVVEAERLVSTATSQAAAAELEYANDSARGRLNKFIRDKVAEGSYAKHLGIIATIRKDFGQLAEIMHGKSDPVIESEVEKARALHRAQLEQVLEENKDLLASPAGERLKEELSAPEPKDRDLRFFNRIVLYIDDLDRCPADKVSEVLQAIHMLLFFPLFVVVVAVDARWITRSLEREFLHLLRDGEATSGESRQVAGARATARGPKEIRTEPLTEVADPAGTGRDGGRGNPLAATGETATAHDYLEKIFQIPFWVRAMDRDSSQKFVAGLIGPKKSGRSGQQAGTSRQAGARLQTGAAQEPGSAEQAGTAQQVGVDPQLGSDEPLPGQPSPTDQRSGVDQQPGGTRAATSGQPQIGTGQQANTGGQQGTTGTLIQVDTLGFTPSEVKTLVSFAEFVGGSPRRAKRFVNLCQLLKTSLRDMPSVSSDPLVDERALIVALAVVTGAPHSASAFFRALAPQSTAQPDGTTTATYPDLSQVKERLPRPDAGTRELNMQDVVVRLIRDNEKDQVSNGPDMTRALYQLANTVRRYSFETAN